MKQTLLILLLLCPISSWAAEPGALEAEAIAHLAEYLLLHPADIGYRQDYTDIDSFRLQIVADYMEAPLSMANYAGSLRSAHTPSQPEVLAAILFRDLARAGQTRRETAYTPAAEELQQRYNLYYTNLHLNQILSRAVTYIEVIIPGSTEQMLRSLSQEQRRFLTREFTELVTIDPNEEFMSAAELDSLEKLSEKIAERFAGFGQPIAKDPVLASGIDFLRELLPEIAALRTVLAADTTGGSSVLTSAAMLPANVSTESYLGRQPGWRIGGPGNDRYQGEYQFILDLGGDDDYELSHNPSAPHPTIIVDLGGNDHYRSITDFTIGSGCLSVGILLDYAGDDRYDAKSFGLGSGFFGFGLLWDGGGDDRYDGDTHGQGAGTFGLGLLIDESGRDVYTSAVYSQGFGFVQGLGALYDMTGSDYYIAGGKYKDVLRFDDRYLSLSQGFGYGVRPLLSGGIGLLIDGRGNDSYVSEIFGQGASYWWSLGVLADSAGNDVYSSYQYAQGSAAHMTLGILLDESGHDVYSGKGLMQGVGHDYSCAILLDRAGNDTYTAYDLSQGAGSANGAGLLIDLTGDDRYLVKSTANTQGFGDPRREFGSIGLMIDLAGSDQYLGNGQDNRYWKTKSRWGGGMDLDWAPKTDTTGARP